MTTIFTKTNVFFADDCEFFDRPRALEITNQPDTVTDRELWDALCEHHAWEGAPMIMLICPQMYEFMQEQLDYLEQLDAAA